MTADVRGQLSARFHSPRRGPAETRAFNLSTRTVHWRSRSFWHRDDSDPWRCSRLSKDPTLAQSALRSRSVDVQNRGSQLTGVEITEISTERTTMWLYASLRFRFTAKSEAALAERCRNSVLQ